MQTDRIRHTSALTKTLQKLHFITKLTALCAVLFAFAGKGAAEELTITMSDCAPNFSCVPVAPATTTKTIWSEDWSSGSSGQTVSDFNSNYSSTGSGTKLYIGTMYAGGTSPELLLASGGGTWTVTLSSLNGYTSGALTLTFGSNNGATVTINGKSLETTAVGTKYSGTVTLSDSDMESKKLTIIFTNSKSSKNTRLDNIVLTYESGSTDPDPDPEPTHKFVLVTSDAGLEVGGTYIIGNGSSLIMTANSGNGNSQSQTITDGEFPATDANAPCELTLGSNGGYYTLKGSGGYIGNSNNTDMTLSSSITDNYTHNITFGDGGKVTIKDKSNSRNLIFANNYNDFRWYSPSASNWTYPYLYKKVSLAPSMSVGADAITFGTVETGAERTVTVTGANLTGITTELTGGVGDFELDTSGLTAYGGVIKVTVTAAEAGDYSGVITVTSANAGDPIVKTVNLSATVYIPDDATVGILKFRKTTDIDPNRTYLIGSQTKNTIMRPLNLGATPMTKTITDNVLDESTYTEYCELKIEDTGETNASGEHKYTVRSVTANKYLSYTSTYKEFDTPSSGVLNNNKFYISFTEGYGNLTLNPVDDANYKLSYYDGSSLKVYKFYTSPTNSIQLYVKDEPAQEPLITVDGEYNVTIAAADDYADYNFYYTTDGSAPAIATATAYSAPFKLDFESAQTITVKAIAVQRDNTDNVSPAVAKMFAIEPVTLWEEDWTGAVTGSSVSAILNAKASYSYTGKTQIFNETYAGGPAPELLLSGTWTITLDPQGYQAGQKLALTYANNNAKASVTINGQSIACDVDGKTYTGAIALTAEQLSADPYNGNIVVEFTATSNTRLDNLSLVNTCKKMPGLAWKNISDNEVSTFNYYYADTPTGNLPHLTTADGFAGTVTYSSSDPAVATIDSEGALTFSEPESAQTTVITASFAGNALYEAGEAAYTLTVTKHSAGKFFFAAATTPETQLSELAIPANTVAELPVLTQKNAGYGYTLTFTPSADNGIVTLGAEGITAINTSALGTVTVTANGTGSQTYYDATATITISVVPNYVRSVRTGYWGTLCVDHGTTSYTGAEFFTVVGKRQAGADMRIYLEKVDGALVAGHPYFFRPEDEAATLELVYDANPAVVEPVNDTAHGFYGTLVAYGNPAINANAFTDLPGWTDENHVYMLQNNTLSRAATTSWIASERAYIVYQDVPAISDEKYAEMQEQSVAGVRQFVSFGMPAQGGVATGVEGVLENESENVYDLSGRRVTANGRRGLFIVNGKKVVR